MNLPEPSLRFSPRGVEARPIPGGERFAVAKDWGLYGDHGAFLPDVYDIG
jgi:hypothetical protein